MVLDFVCFLGYIFDKKVVGVLLLLHRIHCIVSGTIYVLNVSLFKFKTLHVE